MMKRASLSVLTAISCCLTYDCSNPNTQVEGTAVISPSAEGHVPVEAALRQQVEEPVKIYGMRKFPYPYQSMLAISSDADHQTLRKFNLIHRFLNTNEMTPMGRGLGLDISDSFYMYSASNLSRRIDYDGTPLNRQMTYFLGTSDQKYYGDVIHHYIHCGWMDSMHTYGDFTMQNPNETRFHRRLAIRAIKTLRERGDYVTVWMDHGNQSNVDNFGSFGSREFFNYQKGSDPRSPYYHTDLLIPYGIKFVWNERDNSVFGHDSMLIPIRLADGRRVWGFPRFTNTGYKPKSGGTEWVWNMDALSKQLTRERLQSIEQRGEYAVLSQHLCSNNDVNPLAESAVHALRMLKTEYENGKVLVARTSRLLQYNLTQKYLRYYTTYSGGKAVIHLTYIDDPVFGKHSVTLSDIRGVTFYTSHPNRIEIKVWNTPLDPALIQRNPTDGVAPSIMVRWYPRDLKDYSIRSGANHPV
jgi:hypothetical protein